MLSTDILIATHGSAAALMMFLPPEAVTVEIQSYKQALTNDFAQGHSNLARATNTSMLVWNNQHARHTRKWESTPPDVEDFKQQHTYIPDEQIDLILQALLDVWQTPVRRRNYDNVVWLNSPEPLS